jgi:phenylacetate-CoA ligase
MHGLALIYVLRDMPAIDQFKIVQESLARTRVLVTAATTLPAATRAEIAAQFRRRLGADVDISIEQVAEIPRERSGKYRYVVSQVPAPVGAPTTQMTEQA